jgi:nicotinamidase-related amidase
MMALRAGIGDRAAHLCVDMQRLFSMDGPWPTPWLERVLPVVAKVIETKPERTVFTRFITPTTADDMPGKWREYYCKWRDVTQDRIDRTLLDLVPALQKFAPPAPIFNKFVYSAFANGDVHRYLRERHITDLIVTGSETDVCVLATVLGAVDLGYRVVVVRDGVCSTSDKTHEAMIDMYSSRFSVQIELAEADEVIDAWRLSR